MNEVDRGRRRDLFDALAEPLRKRIASGEFAIGGLLPSEPALARAAGVTRYSIRRALAILHGEGLIEPVVGLGWVVLEGRSLPVPRYRQIAAVLRGAMADGRLPAGSALPSEADLVAAHGVARGTVRQALALLESEGLITTHPGKGRYVRGG